MMNQKMYLKKFSHAIRWRLPKSEADEILADYQEIFSQRSKEKDNMLVQEFREPLQAARLLTDPKMYHHWLAAFGFMLICLLVSEFMLLRPRQYPILIMIVPFVIGLVLTMIWFRSCRTEKKKSLFPNGLLPIFAGFIIIIVIDIVIIMGLVMQIYNFLPDSFYGVFAYWTLELTGLVATIVGILGLIKARISDYSWCSLYIMALMVLLECALILGVLTNMDLDAVTSGYWNSLGMQLCIIGLIGLVGVGVNLC